MVLDATTDNLEIILDKAITTNQLSFSVFYNEYTSTTVTPMSNYGTTNSTTAVNLIAAPASGKQRQLRYCSINNVDTVDVGVKIRFNANSSYRNLLYVYLGVNESIQYSEEMGWRIYTANGEEKTSSFNKLPSTIRMPEFLGISTNGATAQSLTNGTSFCIYLGRAERPYSSINFQYRTTTALAATVAWAELGVYKGIPTILTGSSITRLGYADISSSLTSATGTKTTTVTMTGSIAIGDDLWAVFANSGSSTVVSLRAGLNDTGSIGYFQTSASCRPSTNSTIVGSIDSTTLMPWIAWQGTYQGT